MSFVINNNFPMREHQFYDRRGRKPTSLFAKLWGRLRPGRRMSDPASFTSFVSDYKEIFYAAVGGLAAIFTLRRKFSRDNVEIFKDKTEVNLIQMVKQGLADAEHRSKYLQDQLDIQMHRTNEVQQQLIFVTAENQAQAREIYILKEDLEREKRKTVNIIVKAKKEGFNPSITDQGIT